MKVVRQTGIANNIPINIPTRIIASFSGLALYRSRQRRLRLNNDVRFSPSCSGGAAHARVFISSPINLFPYVGSKTLIWKRDEETWEPFLFVFSKFFDTFFEIEYQNRWFLEHDEFDNSVLVEGGWCKGLENWEAISNKYGSREFCIRRWWSDVNREEANIVKRGLTFSISYFGNELRIINVIWILSVG